MIDKIFVEFSHYNTLLLSNKIRHLLISTYVLGKKSCTMHKCIFMQIRVDLNQTRTVIISLQV
jgi:hypothetical protein